MHKITIVAVLVLSVLALLLSTVGAYTFPDVETLCLNEIAFTGGGEVIAWKGHINGAVKCKIRDIVNTDTEWLCYPTRDGLYYWIEPDGMRWVNDDTVVCKYQRK